MRRLFLDEFDVGDELEPEGPIPVVDSTIACIIAREIAEGIMFIASHAGAIMKNDALTRQQKLQYLKALGIAFLAAYTGGAAISLGTGYGMQHAVEDTLENVDYGVELGEGLSKAIGAFFVFKLCLDIPRWFGISNYRKPGAPSVIDAASSNAVLDADDPKAALKASGMESSVVMALSLFWNLLREASEGGVLTALAVILSYKSKGALAASVGVGFGSAVGAGIVFGIGAKFISNKAFGIAAAALAQLLAGGLVTGAVRAFEEVYEMTHGVRTKDVYDFEHTEKGDALSIASPIGIGAFMTEIQISALLLTFVLLCAAQYWKNYLGHPVIPRVVRAWIKFLVLCPIRAVIHIMSRGRFCASPTPRPWAREPRGQVKIVERGEEEDYSAETATTWGSDGGPAEYAALAGEGGAPGYGVPPPTVVAGGYTAGQSALPPIFRERNAAAPAGDAGSI